MSASAIRLIENTIALFVVLAAAAADFAAPLHDRRRRKRLGPDSFLALRGLAVRAVPCLSGNRNGLDALNAYPPLRRKSPACRGAACSFARAASTCNYNGPYVSWQSPPHAQAGT